MEKASIVSNSDTRGCLHSNEIDQTKLLKIIGTRFFTLVLKSKAQNTHRWVLCTCKVTQRRPHRNGTHRLTVEDKNTKYVKGETRMGPEDIACWRIVCSVKDTAHFGKIATKTCKM